MKKFKMLEGCLWVLMSFFCLQPFNLFAFVHAKVENMKVVANQPITLILETDQTSGSEPNLEPLNQDFKVMGSLRTSHVNVINGAVSHQLIYTFSLLPKRVPVGANPIALLIPPITMGSEQSEAITIEVFPPGQHLEEGINQPMFVKATLSSQVAKPGEALIYTFQLYIMPQALGRINQPYLKQPEQTEVKWVSLGDPTQREEHLDGVLYAVLEQRFAVFAHQEGAIEIPSLLFSALVQNTRNPYAFIADAHPIQLSTAPLHITIEPFPSDLGSAHPFTASRVEVSQTWSSAPSDMLKAGELLTRTVHFKAIGAESDRLPEMPALALNQVSVYPSTPVRENQIEHGDLVATSTQKLAYLFVEAGDYSLPETTFSYWNTVNHRLETISLPAQVWSIKPAVTESKLESSNHQDAVPVEHHQISHQFWLMIIAALVLLWMVSLGLVIWILKRKKSSRSSRKEGPLMVFKSWSQRMKSAIQTKNYSYLAMSLLEWSAQEMKQPVRSLGELIMQVHHPELKAWLATLEEILYRNTPDSLDLAIIWHLLKQEKQQAKVPVKKKSSLPGLYD